MGSEFVHGAKAQPEPVDFGGVIRRRARAAGFGLCNSEGWLEMFC